MSASPAIANGGSHDKKHPARTVIGTLLLPLRSHKLLAQMNSIFIVRIELKRDSKYQFLEYACHEGNYAMKDILSGARADEAAKASK